jgi:hypothetical protein
LRDLIALHIVLSASVVVGSSFSGEEWGRHGESFARPR